MTTPAPIPWEDPPAARTRPIWRYSQNPVIRRDLLPTSNSIFNSAIVPFDRGFAGVFRCDDWTRKMQLHRGFSRDGLSWELDPEPIRFECDEPELETFVYGYDPRVVRIEDRVYVTWCNWYHGPTIGVGWTTDFETFHQLENAFLPYNRNGVLFPRKVDGRFAMLSRPSDDGHTPFGDVFYSESPDLRFWGRHRHVLSPVPNSWQATKVGGGPVPLETSAGWLLLYHGVRLTASGALYRSGLALLDLDDPTKVIARTDDWHLGPETAYERTGDVPNVVFPCGLVHDAATGELRLYYGAADTSICLATAQLDDLLDAVLAAPPGP